MESSNYRGRRRSRRGGSPVPAPLISPQRARQAPRTAHSTGRHIMGDKAHAHTGAMRQSSNGRPALLHTECGAGRPQRLRQDDPRRSPRTDRRSGQPGLPGRRRRDDLRLRRDRTPPATLRTALRGPRRMGRVQDQSVGHPRIRRLRRGTQGRSASSGRGPLRCLGGPGGRRRGGHHPRRVGGVRRRRHAARDRRHPPRHRAHLLRRDDPGLWRDIRRRRPRRRPAALSPGARRRGPGRARPADRTHRTPLAADLRLLQRRAEGDPARRRPADTAPGRPQPH